MDSIKRRRRTFQAAALIAVAMLSVSLLAGGTLRASDNRVITEVTLDDPAALPITVAAGDDISAAVKVTFTHANYGSTSWRISALALTPVDDLDDAGFTCVNHEQGVSGLATTFNSVAPSEAGTFHVSFFAYNGNSCNSLQSERFDLPSSIIVVVPGVTVVESGDSTDVTEGGSDDSYTVVLDALPTGDVTITISTDSQSTVDPASLTFDASNLWNVPQTVTVTAADDDVVEGAHTSTITHTVAQPDGLKEYDDIAVASVTANITDDDTAGITITPTLGLVTTEAGGQATFTVVLTSEPTDDVTIGLSSDDESEGIAAPASLTFTSENWDDAQTVTVTGVDDNDIDGDIVYNIVTGVADSTDANYGAPDAIDPADVAVTNNDNDAAGITVSPTSGLVTTEAGGTASFTVVLATQPTADVTIDLSSSDPTEGIITSATTLTFTSSDWNSAQTVTVTGVDDSADDGDVRYFVLTAAAGSGDTSYNGLDPANVAVTNNDNDATPPIVSSDVTPSDADACKTNGWEAMLFRNQGLCISHGDGVGGVVLLGVGSGDGGPPWPRQADWDARERGNSGGD